MKFEVLAFEPFHHVPFGCFDTFTDEEGCERRTIDNGWEFGVNSQLIWFCALYIFDTEKGESRISYSTVLPFDYIRLTCQGSIDDCESFSFSSDFWIS